jgi:hypothetical protein
MPHKFKIGGIVKYRSADRRHREADGVYVVTSRVPGDGPPQYRIKHQARSSSASRWRTSCQLVSPSMANDDPHAPYKVYEGEECKGIYPTRAEAQRAQRRLAEAEPQRNFFIRDVLDRVVI